MAIILLTHAFYDAHDNTNNGAGSHNGDAFDDNNDPHPLPAELDELPGFDPRSRLRFCFFNWDTLFLEPNEYFHAVDHYHRHHRYHHHAFHHHHHHPKLTLLCCSCASANKLFSVLKEFDLPVLMVVMMKINVKMVVIMMIMIMGAIIYWIIVT